MGSTFKIFYFYISKFLARKKKITVLTQVPFQKVMDCMQNFHSSHLDLFMLTSFFVELRPITPGKPTKLSGTALD